MGSPTDGREDADEQRRQRDEGVSKKMTSNVSSQVSRQNGQIETKSIRELREEAELKKLWKKACEETEHTDSGTHFIEENFR